MFKLMAFKSVTTGFSSGSNLAGEANPDLGAGQSKAGSGDDLHREQVYSCW